MDKINLKFIPNIEDFSDEYKSLYPNIYDSEDQNKIVWDMCMTSRALRTYYMNTISDSDIIRIHNYEKKSESIKTFLTLKDMRKLTGHYIDEQFNKPQITELIEWCLLAKPKSHIWHGMDRHHKWDINSKSLLTHDFNTKNSKLSSFLGE